MSVQEIAELLSMNISTVYIPCYSIRDGTRLGTSFW
jgi:DNA-binding CsgD family transcriptional regulator